MPLAVRSGSCVSHVLSDKHCAIARTSLGNVLFDMIYIQLLCGQITSKFTRVCSTKAMVARSRNHVFAVGRESRDIFPFCHVKVEKLREDQAVLKIRAEEAEQENARLAHCVEDWRGRAAAAVSEYQQLKQEAWSLRRAYEVFFHCAYGIQIL